MPDRITEPWETIELGRLQTERGEVVLRRRPDRRVFELIVNGAFAMDSAETTTEQELARIAVAGAPVGRHVLVGGLGLGFTVATLCDTEVATIDVAELEPGLVDWALAGLTPTYARIAADPRVRLLVADVADLLTAPERTWDAIVLDVDNGPDFLIHEHNAALYSDALLGAAASRLSAGGVLAIWCQGPAPDLGARLQRLPGTTREHRYPVTREGREFSYVIYAYTADPGTVEPDEPPGVTTTPE